MKLKTIKSVITIYIRYDNSIVTFDSSYIGEQTIFNN